MRSYGQFCGLARALDVVGSRWSLLVVRDLLGGPRGYAELSAGLPGVASNLLVQRLRALEEDGVVTRDDDGRYRLTPWGEGLREPIYALGRWAGPLMAQPRGDDHFRVEWLHHMVIARFDGHDPRRRDLVVELRCDDATFTLISVGGRVRLVRGPDPSADVGIAGPTEPVVGLLLGRIDRERAVERGVSTSGAVSKLRGLRPRGERPATG